MRQLSEMQRKYAVEEQKQLYILGQDGLEVGCLLGRLHDEYIYIYIYIYIIMDIYNIYYNGKPQLNT